MQQLIVAMQAVLVLVSLMCLSGTGDCESNNLYCDRGEYLDQEGQETCRPCGSNSFMDEYHHRNTECKPCGKVDTNHAYYDVVSDCNKTHDVVIECRQEFCEDSHFPDEPCRRCRDCSSIGQFPAKHCTKNEDCVCCPKKSMVVKYGVCIDLPTTEKTPENVTISKDDEQAKDSVDAVTVIVIVICVLGLIVFLIIASIFIYSKFNERRNAQGQADRPENGNDAEREGLNKDEAETEN
ncbi:pleckstrin like proteiny domain-containing family g member 5 [Plakobranchus ocellatus]|uniref:Pleckstrin like proteiny domain-containing family g member 5 n=1 Tax=Plakobranchus ocellatus TaxID=259542 RepID=A0AAV4C4K0_9GAST|nr:pleckstrin like proteiny domain-containing family g member 5 [Plakobranchus ocellatus]